MSLLNNHFADMAGIKNLGRTCYVAALIQGMGVSDECGVHLRSHRYDHNAVPENCLMCVLSALVDYISQLPDEYKDKTPTAINKREFRKFTRALNLREDQPGDPRELFLDIMHTHVPSLQTIFGISLRRTTICNTCHNERVNSQIEFTLSISGGNTSLRQGVINCFAPKNYIGNCEICNSVEQQTSFLWAENYPINLCIHNVTACEIQANTFIKVGFMEYKLLGMVQAENFDDDKLRHYVSLKRFPGNIWILNDDHLCEEVYVPDKYKSNLYLGFFTTYPEIGGIHSPTEAHYEEFKETVHRRITLCANSPGESMPYPSGLISPELSSDADLPRPVLTSDEDQHTFSDIMSAHRLDIDEILNIPKIATETACTSETQPTPSTSHVDSGFVSPQVSVQQDIGTSDHPEIGHDDENVYQPSTSYTDGVSFAPDMTETSNISILGANDQLEIGNAALNDETLISEGMNIVRNMSTQPNDPDISKPFKKRRIRTQSSNIDDKTTEIRASGKKSTGTRENTVQSVNESDKEPSIKRRRSLSIKLTDVMKKQNLEKVFNSGIRVNVYTGKQQNTCSRPQLDPSDEGTAVKRTRSADDTSSSKPRVHKTKKKKVTVRSRKHATKKKPSKENTSALKQLRSWGKNIDKDLTKEREKRKQKLKKRQAELEKKDIENRKKVVPKRGKVNIKMFKKANIQMYDPDDSTSSTDDDEQTEEESPPKQPKRKYSYVKWKPRSKSNHEHMSIVRKSDSFTVPDAQLIPGGCILCSERIYLSTQGEVEKHFENVHWKHSTTIRDYRLLMCKCDDIRPRGSDGRMRNRHYHCPFCFKPSDSLVLLAKHVFTKHGIKAGEISHLKYKPRKN